ncbi:hypothetical protein [Clostridium perfringens]|uniref:Uncharacterized protein n=2 Tax=Clostridium perfringens TaxID=1502 RepID=A0AAP6WQW0_CLOPF|nr:hypothetical protein [Clostridium perfringens]NP_612858.1 Gp29 protein [Clostridium phage phi3626]AAL96799.1 Gp29 protein [Clostridium phage phi3626]EDT22894.1 conserved domain protein [Clostridium perfringens B str. ATCC 3626]NGU30634.1 hypothetical protein [Clostridium perfringens]WEV05047.1 hypothetical protein PL322_13850 [Clostridium perfringens B]
MFRVDFIDIGASNKNFSKYIKEINHENLYHAVKPYLQSRNIWFTCRDGEGVVFAGFQTVGKFKVIIEI